ncbi:alpha-N-acetylglucosaminidase-like isoform X2 [Daphnia pulicaria]|uniref:alpha-N-acetylglucosaminidase-like isoform X2 n=1 Tax=Daphnia pulicaria TaxID=35523 RepID=UPI001EEA6BAB|nr:alpha-N-acetylglucosaminidase-like isoform X2 [Daphnia pulicaria]
MANVGNSSHLILVLIFSIFQGGLGGSLDNIRTRTSVDIQAQAVRDLIERLLPERASEFDVKVEPGLLEDENGYFQVIKTPENTTVFLQGSTGVMAAWGFHYYLTQLCHCQVSWDADQLDLPVILPEVSVRITSLDKFRYYQNTCTSSYSFAWWKWPRWEREIDWMAMNGINLPLAFTGQEIIWQRVYLGLGLKQEDLDEHFAGPAFFAWQRMGNFRAWGGPLSDNWQQATLILQHKILERMRSFGMTPVLPAFAGHVPRAMERVYPNASYTHLTSWLNFQDQYCCPLFLQPTEPLFTEIGSRFIKEMALEFGSDHVYNCDVFNEVRPKQADPVFVSSVGTAVFNAMTTADPDAIWLMQGWLFKSDAEYWTADLSKALLTSVPQGRMLILDLQAELDPQYIRLNSFYGQPFVFCLLHNFGGTLGLNGAIQIISQRVIDARNFPNSTIVGTGLTMEGIDQNYVVYDKMLEMGWRDKVPNLNQWFDEYTVRRYGVNNTAVMSAWRFLQNSVYNDSSRRSFRGQYVLVTRPALWQLPFVWYSPHDVILAWDHLISGLMTEPLLSNASNFRHDMVDLTRQSMQEIFHLLYSKLLEVYLEKNSTAIEGIAYKMINLLQDLDELLQTGKKFLLGKWIADAKSWGTTEGEKLQYEWNARNQITLWGPRGEIRDYAAKQWAGVVADYYKPRWEVFIREMQMSLDENRAFNKKAYETLVFTAVEEPFTTSTKHYSDVPIGDPIVKVMTLYDKWRKIYQQDSKSLSTKARKLWRGQSLPDDKVKSVKIKQHPRKQPKQPLSTTNKTPPIVPAQ